MLEKYRESMTDEIVHSWAKDAQAKIDKLSNMMEELSSVLKNSYFASKEGRDYLKRMSDAINT